MDTENARGEDASKRSAESAGLSRRSFLQGSIAAGAALAMGAFASGCAPTESTAKGDPKTEGDDTAATQERAVLTPTETRDVDVVVVGAGVGGMAAALQAVEQGLNTVLLEKESVTGGTSSYAEGMFAIDSHWQQEADVDYTTAEVLQKVMEYHHWMADAELTKAFFDASGDTIAWLESKGGVFTGVETLGPSLRTWHTYEGMGAGFTKRLAEACRSQGVDVLVKTAAKQLVIADDGSVSGVIAEAGSDLVQFNARGVILTSGGYADNADMINEYTMHDYDDLTVMGTPERTGDGIQMALEAGADTHVLGTMMMCGGAIKGMSASSQLNVCAGRQPMLWVNEHGERFANEGIVTNFSFTGNAMGLQREVFNVIDAAAMRHITEVGCYNGRGVYIRTGEPMTEFHGEFEKEQAAGNPYIFKADTLEELCDLTGMEREPFLATVEHYNELCAEGADADYGKKADYLQPVKEAPFYAFKLAKAYYCTVGGLKVNTNNQVISTEGSPIGGLYAAGCDAGGLYGSSYDVGIAAGSQQGWTAHGGRTAAKHLASL